MEDSLASNDSKDLYDTYKKLFTCNNMQIPDLLHKKKWLATPQAKAAALNRSFATPPTPPTQDVAFTTEVNDFICHLAKSKPSELQSSTNDTLLHQHDIQAHEVLEAITHVSKYKATGPDKVHNMMLKEGGDALPNFSTCVTLLVIFLLLGKNPSLNLYRNRVAIILKYRIIVPLPFFRAFRNFLSEY